ncbi:MAG: divalent metal cation transporter, partial [Planctomycetota bacterium]
RPVLGDLSVWAFAIGLFAAGLTSSITAPLATGYAVCGLMGWSTDVSSKRFRIIALSVIGIAVAFVLIANKAPAQTITIAQIANGLLLPIVAVILLVAVFTNKDMPRSRLQEVSGVLVVLFVSLLAGWKLWKVFVG